MRTRFAHYARGLSNLVSLEKGNVERHASAWAALKLCAILLIEKTSYQIVGFIKNVCIIGDNFFRLEVVGASPNVAGPFLSPVFFN